MASALQQPRSDLSVKGSETREEEVEEVARWAAAAASPLASPAARSDVSLSPSAPSAAAPSAAAPSSGGSAAASAQQLAPLGPAAVEPFEVCPATAAAEPAPAGAEGPEAAAAALAPLVRPPSPAAAAARRAGALLLALLSGLLWLLAAALALPAGLLLALPYALNRRAKARTARVLATRLARPEALMALLGHVPSWLHTNPDGTEGVEWLNVVLTEVRSSPTIWRRACVCLTCARAAPTMPAAMAMAPSALHKTFQTTPPNHQKPAQNPRCGRCWTASSPPA